MRSRRRASLLIISLAIAVMLPISGVAAGVTSQSLVFSCKVDVVFGTVQNSQDCIGVASGGIVAPDGNILAVGEPVDFATGSLVEKYTQPCATDAKPRGGKCYHNFRLYDLVVDASWSLEPLVISVWGRFSVSCMDVSKDEACSVSGSFDLATWGTNFGLTIPSKHVLKDSKGVGSYGVQINEDGKDYPPCTANPSGLGSGQLIFKQIPQHWVKTTVWLTGTIAVAC